MLNEATRGFLLGVAKEEEWGSRCGRHCVRQARVGRRSSEIRLDRFGHGIYGKSLYMSSLNMLVIINDANLALSSFLSTTLSSSSTYSPPSQDFADAAE